MPSSSPSAVDPTPSGERDSSEAKAAFHLRMRARGIRDLAVLRAFELVPRAHFVPPLHRDLAGRDLPIPIDCGQTMHEPWLVARMIEALGVAPHHRVLEIGSGTGYATAILSHLAGETIGLERFAGLAHAAQARLDTLAIANAAVVRGDGTAVPAEGSTFDRVLVHGLLADVPSALAARLDPDGVLVAAFDRPEGQAIVRMTRPAGTTWRETIVCPSRLRPLASGLAAAL